MNGYVDDIEKATIENDKFRKVLYTAKNSQLVVMSIPSGGEIGEEVHDLDQFIRIEAGEGRAVLDGKSYDVKDDTAIVVPAGASHNVVNTGTEALKLYTIYSPPEHRDGVVHETRQEAEADGSDHFDGKTTE